jgi:hypothetical protein
LENIAYIINELLCTIHPDEANPSAPVLSDIEKRDMQTFFTLINKIVTSDYGDGEEEYTCFSLLGHPVFHGALRSIEPMNLQFSEHTTPSSDAPD